MPKFGPYVRETTTDEEAHVTVAQAGNSEHDDYMPQVDYHRLENGQWAVWLPHDCDEWVIGHGTKEETLDQLNTFIESLNAAKQFLDNQ